MRRFFAAVAFLAVAFIGLGADSQLVHVERQGFPITQAPPALGLYFARDGALDSRITYSGGANGTLFNADGDLVYAAHNLIRTSDMTGASAGTPGDNPDNWVITLNGVTQEIVTVGTINGINTIDLKLSGTPSGDPIIAFEATTGIDGVTTETFSASAFIAIIAGDTTNITAINLQHRERTEAGGFVKNNSGPDIKGSLTATLQRFSYTVALSGGGTVAHVVPAILIDWDDSGPIDLTLRIGVPQQNRGPTALAVVETTNAAVWTARFDHNPVTGAPLGLRIEEERENVIIQSNDPTAAGWTAVNGAASAVTLLNPAGNTSSYKFQADGGGESYLQQTAAKTVTSGADQSLSWIVKRGNNDFVILIGWDNSTNGIRQWFNLSNGSVGTATAFGSGFTVVSADAENLGNDWYRLKVTYGITGTTFQVSLALATADGTVGTPANGQYVNLYSSGIEEGSFVTSPIFTTTAAVTRTSDVVTMLVSAFDFNQSAGTILVEAITPVINTSVRTLYQIDDGGTSDRIRAFLNTATDDIAFRTESSAGDNGSVQISGVVANTSFKHIGAYANDDIAASLDGGAVGTDITAGIPTTDALTTFHIGMRNGNNEPWNGTIALIEYWNRRLPDLTIEDKTSFLLDGLPTYAANDNFTFALAA